MRSSWDPAALYCSFDAGPSGMAHWHYDNLSFTIYAYGKNMIVDPGKIVTFGNFKTSKKHNTISVDGYGQAGESAVSAKVSDSPWITNDRFDFVASKHTQGYGGRNERTGIVHERQAFFLKGEYWIISDLVRGSGRHRITSNFHINSELLDIDKGVGIVRTRDERGANLAIAATSSEDLSFRQYFGETEQPHRGWMIVWGTRKQVANMFGKKQRAIIRSGVRANATLVPIVKLEIEQNGKLPLGLDTLIYPYPESKRTPRISLMKDVNGKNQYARELHVSLQDTPAGDKQLEDYFVTSFEGSQTLEVADFSLQGQAAHIRKKLDGQLVHILLINATEISEGKKLLVQCQPEAQSLSIIYKDDTVLVEGSEPDTFKVYAPGVSKLILNNRSVAATRQGGYLEIQNANRAKQDSN
jgi:hypothetical protein